MKYIDANRLKDEIKHLKIDVYDEAHQFDLGARSSLTFLESFIDSLQQEQPDNEDIDKVAQELYEHLYELKRRNNVPTNLYDKQEIIDLWKAGIVYGRSHPKQEQQEVDLEKEYKEYVEDDWVFGTLTIRNVGLAIAKHFYELGLNTRKEDNK